MKKILGVIIALTVLVALMIPVAGPVAAAPITQTYELFACQTIPVGYVEVTNDTENITVTFVIDSPWELVETHVAAATTLAGIPQKNGNPIPGKFAYSGNPITIPLSDGPWDAEDNLVIAAHAVVNKVQAGSTISASLVSEAGTDNVLFLSEDPLNPGYPVGYTAPYQNYTGTPIPSVLAWTHSAWAPYGIAGAQWISSAYNAETPDNNTWRLFTRSFTLPTNATNISGTMTVNCDNAEDVYLNGVKVGDGSPAVVYGASPPSGPAHGWSSVEGPWNVTLVAGNNSLWTMTRNYGWPGGVNANPTAYIYKLSYSYDIPPIVLATETAWGATAINTTAFAGKNWATHFLYTVQ